MLRSARERAGWTREALAYHSGVTWSAIAQIESGRRQDVRLSSLAALAAALGVSVDYLAGAPTTIRPDLARHRGLIYGSDEDFVVALAPFLAEGVARADGVLAVTGSRQTGLLREALGHDARQVKFVDSSEWYDSPTGALHRYLTFVQERFQHGAPWVRIIGEPVWSGRSRAEVAAWKRYESIINLSFASLPASVICPYDARSVPRQVLVGARHTHPELAEEGRVLDCPDYREPEDFLLTVP
jgi:transcriptional regulator with XRE-family HTH domain